MEMRSAGGASTTAACGAIAGISRLGAGVHRAGHSIHRSDTPILYGNAPGRSALFPASGVQDGGQEVGEGGLVDVTAADEVAQHIEKLVD